MIEGCDSVGQVAVAIGRISKLNSSLWNAVGRRRFGPAGTTAFVEIEEYIGEKVR